MSLRAMLPLTAVLSLSLPLHAQDSTLAPGTRVRVLSACDTTAAHTGCDVVKGRLVSRTGNALLIQDAGGAEHRVEVSPGVRIQQSAGFRRHTLRGLGIGSAVGLATGALLLADCTRGDEDDALCGVRLVVPVPVGAVLGTLVGALTRSERWSEIPESRASLHLRPVNGHTGVGLAIRF
ncbi:MAG TPA: hypothetical protein VFK36_09555 [Gemmatimonadales bacterium]|nr:hypothetical protein [Gemmatimonadales bacterium]